MPRLIRIAVPLGLGVAALVYLTYPARTACDLDPRGRACFEQVLEAHFGG
jgi:hypothetical protein